MSNVSDCLLPTAHCLLFKPQRKYYQVEGCGRLWKENNLETKSNILSFTVFKKAHLEVTSAFFPLFPISDVLEVHRPQQGNMRPDRLDLTWLAADTHSLSK